MQKIKWYKITQNLIFVVSILLMCWFGFSFLSWDTPLQQFNPIFNKCEIKDFTNIEYIECTTNVVWKQFYVLPLIMFLAIITAFIDKQIKHINQAKKEKK